MPRSPHQSGPPERKSHAAPHPRTGSQRRSPPGRAGWRERLNQKRPETEFGTRDALTVTQMRIILDGSVGTVKRLRVSLGTLVAIEATGATMMGGNRRPLANATNVT